MSIRWNLKAQSRIGQHRPVLSRLTVGCLLLGLSAWAKDASAPSAADAQSRTSLHQEVLFKASPQRLYEILLSSQQFTAFSGLPAVIDPKVGGAFSLFGGKIVGRNVELIPNQLLVQAWRPADWPTGTYSLVRIQLKAQGAETLLLLDHSGFPAGGFDHLSSGWTEHYWQPLSSYLASGAK